ncbi:MAG: hypothetical protein ABI702_21410 [Burkholderiales bacterium]
MDVYTGWLDYGATGEGRSLVAYIGWAENPDRLRERASVVFGEFLGQGLEVAEGVVANPVTSALFSTTVFDQLRRLGRRANIKCHALMHFNLS